MEMSQETKYATNAKMTNVNYVSPVTSLNVKLAVKDIYGKTCVSQNETKDTELMTLTKFVKNALRIAKNATKKLAKDVSIFSISMLTINALFARDLKLSWKIDASLAKSLDVFNVSKVSPMPVESAMENF